MHSLARRIYETDPHTLTDAIKEVEKLHAAQQLTTTIIPASTVNMMSKKKISVSCASSQAIPHDTAHTSDAIKVTNTDTLSWTSLTKYHL